MLTPCSCAHILLIVLQREILKKLKHEGKEPSSGLRVIEELFNRGDIVSADSLKPPGASQSYYSLASLRSSISGYIWGPKKSKTPSLDDPIVPLTALKAAVERASSLSGPMASADIHTVKTFAAAVTGGNTRDAEAVISHIVSKGEASVLFTEPTKDSPEPLLGVKFGKGTATEADKGVLRTKAALEQMEKRTLHLTEEIERESAAATSLAKAGKKSDALSRLRKRKVLETKLTGSRAAASKLSDVLLAVDEAESNREAVSALETGMSSLKVATEEGVTADRVDAVAADFDEMLAEQQDVRVALAQLNEESAENDAVLLEELDQLVSGEKQEQPARPTTTDEEIELMKLMQELDIPETEPAQMKDPAQVAHENLAKAGEGESASSVPAGDEQGTPAGPASNLSASAV